MVERQLAQFQELPDAVVPDLEDSVPESQKIEARKIVSEFIRTTWRQFKEERMRAALDPPLLIPRVNFTHQHLELDLQAVLSAGRGLIDVCC